MITILPLLTLLTVSLAGDLNSGYWGTLKVKNRDNKCYGYDERSDQLYTRNCNALDDLQLWRYDTKTQQLQNKGISAARGEPYCAVLSEVGYLKPIRIGPCFHSSYNAFIVDAQGASQAFHTELDRNMCIDVDTSFFFWAVNDDARIHTANCEDQSQGGTDHWTVFTSVGRYTGPALSNLPKQKSFRDGDWGSLVVNRGLAGCYGVEHSTKKLQQQTCDDYDEGQKWRYNVASKTINNYKFPLDEPYKGCLTIEGRSIFMRRCYDSDLQKFLLNDGTLSDGTFQRVQLFSDVTQCLDVTGITFNVKGVRPIQVWGCEGINDLGSDHWLKFNYWKAGSVSCPGGKYPVNDVCQPCPKNTISTQGSTSCTPCPSDTISEAGSTSCIKVNTCKAGTYLNGKSCTNCPINSYIDQDAASSCKKCPAGYYTNGAGSTTCLKKPSCLAGQFVNNGGCVDCPRNTYSNAVDAVSCTKCATGFEAKNEGSTKCTEKQDRVEIIVTPKTQNVECALKKKKPDCILQCRFILSNGLEITDVDSVQFFKKSGSSWNRYGTTAYSTKYRWFNVRVAVKPLEVDGGVYKCQTTYNGMSAAAEIIVTVK